MRGRKLDISGSGQGRTAFLWRQNVTIFVNDD